MFRMSSLRDGVIQYMHSPLQADQAVRSLSGKDIFGIPHSMGDCK